MSDDTEDKTNNPETAPDAADTVPADAAEGASGAADADRPREAPYRIESQYVKDLSFESPRSPAVFTNPLHQNARINVAVDVATQTVGPRRVEVTLLIEAKADTDEGIVYVFELSYAAIVAVGPVPKEAVPPLLLIEVPRMLFPFARGIVANTTRDGGFNTLFLAPYDFLGLFEAKMNQQVEAAEQGAGDSEADAAGSDTETA